MRRECEGSLCSCVGRWHLVRMFYACVVSFLLCYVWTGQPKPGVVQRRALTEPNASSEHVQFTWTLCSKT